MPRKARDERLDTRAARLRLKVRREPYWRTIQEGRAIGYRRLASGKAGTWIARHYDREHGRRYCALGSADDLLEADGRDTLTFAQAQDAAAAWFRTLALGAAAPEPEPEPVRFTVREAVELYLADYVARGGKARRYVETTFAAHVLPRLGNRLVADLTAETIRRWHHALAAAPARLRSGAGRKRNVREAGTPDAQRARRATANGVLVLLKAALNLAFREGKVPSDAAWRRVRPFQKVAAARVRYLTDTEALRLVNACPPDLRALVSAALLTGCRYAELAALRPGDIDLAAGVLVVREAKAGKPRSVVLTAEAVALFRGLVAGRPADAPILTRDDGSLWGKNLAARPLREACRAAGIAPAIGFHVLRHTHASRLAQAGVPMAVIAAQLGHSSVKITEAHYAHLSPGYVAETIRAAFGSLGLAGEDQTVVALRG